MNLELTLKHFKMFSHTQCSTNGIEMSNADRFIWEDGDEIKEFDLSDSHVHWVGDGALQTDGALQAVIALQILQSEGFKAGLFWDDYYIDGIDGSFWGWCILSNYGSKRTK
jgi:hypothetical protein